MLTYISFHEKWLFSKNKANSERVAFFFFFLTYLQISFMSVLVEDSWVAGGHIFASTLRLLRYVFLFEV